MSAAPENFRDLNNALTDNEEWSSVQLQSVLDEHIFYTHSQTEIYSADYTSQATFYHDSMYPKEVTSGTLSSFSYTQERPHPEISLVVCDSHLPQNYRYSFETNEQGVVFSTIVSGDIENVLLGTLQGRTNKSQNLRFSVGDTVYSFQDYQGYSTIYHHTPFR